MGFELDRPVHFSPRNMIKLHNLKGFLMVADNILKTKGQFLI